MRIFLSLVLLVALLSAGCTDAPEDTDQDDTQDTTNTETNATAPEPKVFTGSGTATASTSVGGFSSGGLEATVEQGATLLYAELQWDDPVADLDLALSSPSSGSAAGEINYDHSASGGSPGSPDSPHSLTIESPEAGGWVGGAVANGAAADVQYTIVATVFYGETAVPGGYTALE